MIRKLLQARQLPALLAPDSTPDRWRSRRQELLALLSREEYGFTPEKPEKVTGVIREENPIAFAGKAVMQTVDLSFSTPSGPFSFPLRLAVPRQAEPAPAFVYVSFRPDFPDQYLPVEEILDHGFAVAAFCYKDVTDDSAVFDKLAAMYPREPQTGWGKIGMWAFAASRVLDYLETRQDVDEKRVCVSGHSRLGKTALWCAAQDERFSMAVSNDSGCSGAALSRGCGGETVERITSVFPFWFCGNYARWSGRESEMPFDQHMLLALIAPRRLVVTSAQEDAWADPVSEFLGCAAASEAWEVYRLAGLKAADQLPKANQPLMDGGICYQMRTGTHFHSRTDWAFQMACREKYSV